MLAECYGQVGNIDGQITALSDVIKTFPEELDNFKQIGLIQFERANHRLANFCLGKVAERGNVSPEIVEKLEAANSILKEREQYRKRSTSDRPTISACLMVKDEEHCLENCLKSIKGFVDEIIVVDTGSTDGTIEIAENYGAKVYHHPWEGDFSKHRNQSMSYAKGDWILIIDADEVLEPESSKAIRAIAKQTPKNAILFKVINCSSKGECKSLLISPRLFRNDIGCHYRGIVHNQPYYPREEEPSSLKIYHYGYDLSPEQMKAKGKRTIELLEKQIAMNPEAIFPRFNLTISKFMAGDFLASVKEGEKAIRLIQKYGATEPGYAALYYIVSATYWNLKNPDRAEKSALEGVAYYAEHLDVFFVLTLIYDHKNDYSKVSEYGERYLKLHKEICESKASRNLEYRTMANKWMVLLSLSFACYRLHRLDNVRRYFEEACNCASLDLFPASERAKFCIRIGQYDAAQNYLQATLEQKNHDCKG